MSSIKGQLLIGLFLSGLIGGMVLVVIVMHQYGLIGTTPSPFSHVWYEMRDHVLIPFLVFVVFFGIGAYFVVGRVERKLITASKEAMAAADSLSAYQTPIEQLPLELRPFARAQNHLTLKLANHARRQESFAADAAHELKTPLAILALELDKLPADDAARLGVQMQSLSEMIDQLLILARSNSLDMLSNPIPVQPGRVAQKLVAEIAPTAIDAGKILSFEDNYPTSFFGLEEAIGAALRTLTVNALRVTPPGGEVVVSAGPGPQFTVSDGGSGLSETELERLKARGKRSDHAPGGVAGLGLAIADRIVEAHGGEMRSCMPERVALRLDFSKAPRSK